MPSDNPTQNNHKEAGVAGSKSLARRLMPPLGKIFWDVWDNQTPKPYLGLQIELITTGVLQIGRDEQSSQGDGN